jgi:putative transposase
MILGTPVEEVCRKMGIADAMFYTWKKRHGSLEPSEVRRLQQLEEENTQLKKLATAMNQIWSMDFVADALFDGRRWRA